jgi:V8-like Glu-specific endopeptidase
MKMCYSLFIAAAWFLPGSALRGEEFPASWVELPHDSGIHSNLGPTTNLVWSTTLEVPEAIWLRVQFANCQLGLGSYVLLTSEATQRSQRLTAVGMQHWSKFSGALKGGRVRAELYVAPGDENIFVQVSRVRAGERPLFGFLPATLCDGDSRINTRDDRVGRMFGGGCTAWLINNGAVLSAGHCVDGGLGSFFEVNVPASDADGSVNPADPDDQFPMVGGSQVWELIGETGRDWGIFDIGPNSNTGERAHVGRGFFRITQVVPALATSLRITGYGNDSTPTGSTGGFNNDHRTEQTSTGPFGGQTIDDAQVSHLYRVDTEPANSGSPIIWRIGTTDFSIGIHTDGGCSSGGDGFNYGTSFNQQNLATTVNTWPAATVRYLDTVAATAEVTGSIFRPYRNFNAAYSGTPNGGTLVLVAGSHAHTTAGNTGTFGSGQTKSITLRAPVGAVTIGN